MDSESVAESDQTSKRNFLITSYVRLLFDLVKSKAHILGIRKTAGITPGKKKKLIIF